MHLFNGLQALHQNNVIHRDIKPSNLLIARGVLLISDFGWARELPSAIGDKAQLERNVYSLWWRPPKSCWELRRMAFQPMYGRLDAFVLKCVKAHQRSQASQKMALCNSSCGSWERQQSKNGLECSACLGPGTCSTTQRGHGPPGARASAASTYACCRAS